METPLHTLKILMEERIMDVELELRETETALEKFREQNNIIKDFFKLKK